MTNAHSYTGSLLHDPWKHLTGSGTQFRVFTPFWKSFRAGTPPRAPLPTPDRINGQVVPGDGLDSWELRPTLPWAQRFPEVWNPGESGARMRLDRFISEGLPLYHRRDEPGIEATSGLSPHLRFGEMSPYRLWWDITNATTDALRPNVDKFLSELGWREFSYHQLFHNPALAEVNLRADFNAFPWHTIDPEIFRSWTRGVTGFSLIDAGMRELWAHGTMHNRVRMVSASFLIKNLGVDWRVGEQWFWDTLVDADEAGEHAKSGGLARPIGTEQPEHLAIGDTQCELVNGKQRSEATCEPVGLNHVYHPLTRNACGFPNVTAHVMSHRSARRATSRFERFARPKLTTPRTDA